jgi:hypothetical protein
MIKAKGRVVKNGEPFRAEDGEGLRIFFDPVDIGEGTTTYDSFAAEYHATDGTFEVRGKNGKGLPTGNYRISLQLMKAREDQLKGSAMGKRSPFTCEITGKQGEVVIDLDKLTPVEEKKDPEKKIGNRRR